MLLYGIEGDMVARYHPEFQDNVQGSNAYPNNLLGISFVVAVGL